MIKLKSLFSKLKWFKVNYGYVQLSKYFSGKIPDIYRQNSDAVIPVGSTRVEILDSAMHLLLKKKKVLLYNHTRANGSVDDWLLRGITKRLSFEHGISAEKLIVHTGNVIELP